MNDSVTDIDTEEQNRYKMLLFYKLRSFRNQGFLLTKDYTMNNSIEEMVMEIESIEYMIKKEKEEKEKREMLKEAQDAIYVISHIFNKIINDRL